MTTASESTVAHVTSAFYRLSENWIYTQVANHERYEPIVLTRWLSRREFDFPSYSLAHRSIPGQLIDVIRRARRGYHPLFSEAVKRHGVRLIHAHFGVEGFYALGLAEATNAALITTFYGYDLSRLPRNSRLWRERYRRLFRLGDCFLVEGNHMRGLLVALGCPAEKIRVQHLGVEVGRFPFLRRTLETGRPLRILIVGRLVEKKGIAIGIRALARFLERGGSATMTIVGGLAPTIQSRRVKSEIAETIQRNGLGAAVELRGFESHAALIRSYLDHDLILAPSIEAFDGENEGGAPVGLIEAAATGMPAIASRHCDIPSVVRDGETGYLAEEGDVEGLSQLIERFAEDPAELARMGAAARVHVVESYDAQLQARKLEAIYDEVLANRPATRSVAQP